MENAVKMQSLDAECKMIEVFIILHLLSFAIAIDRLRGRKRKTAFCFMGVHYARAPPSTSRKKLSFLTSNLSALSHFAFYILHLQLVHPAEGIFHLTPLNPRQDIVQLLRNLADLTLVDNILVVAVRKLTYRRYDRRCSAAPSLF